MTNRIRVTVNPNNFIAHGAVASAIQQLEHDGALSFEWAMSRPKPTSWKNCRVVYTLKPARGAKPEILRILREAAALGD